MINSFSGKYRFLSNFYMIPIRYNKIVYPSVENAYQACKTNNIELRKQFIYCSAKKAKLLGHYLVLRPHWNCIRQAVMYNLLVIKFKNNTLRQLLINTGDQELIEGNYWNDTYWGICRGIGENNLGKLLMRLRSELNEINY